MESRSREPHTCSFCAGISILLRCVGHCWHCSTDFAINDPNSVEDLETDEHCPRCGDLGTRRLIAPRVKLPHTFADAGLAADGGCELWQHWTRGARWPQLDSTCSLVIYGTVTSPSPKNPCSKLFVYASWVGAQGAFAPTYGCLTGWAETSDPASRIIASRPYETDVNSATSRKFIRECLATCLSTHERCRASSTPTTAEPELTDPKDVPARLLDLGEGDGDPETISLFLTGDADSSARKLVSTVGFAILSYCWGGPNPTVLTRRTLESLQRRINVTLLPASIRDAVAVARSSGCRFLWIDALCILQDDGRDEADEIANMGQYYAAARLTISAASASACSEGFLGPRDPPPPLFGPVRVPLRFANRVSAGTVLLSLVEQPEAAMDAAATGPPQPIARRGWTMQESLLSRRMLVYTTNVLHWACLSTTASNGGESCVLRETPTENRVALVPGIYPFAWLLKWPTADIWRFLVEEYSGRLLGKPEDKLLAISGAAERTVEVSVGRGEDPAYVAGCLVQRSSPASWALELLWVPERWTSTTRPVKYRAPSWSWASFDGHCRFINILKVDKARSMVGPTADLESYAHGKVESIGLQYPDAPYGGVSGAVLKIRALTHQLVTMAAEPSMVEIVLDEDESGISSIPAVDVNQPPPRTKLVLRGDTAEDHQRIKQAAAKRGSMGEPEILLVSLARVIWKEQRVSANLVRGLVVEAVEGGKHARIGTFAALRCGMDLDSMDAKLNWFLGDPESILLV